MIEEVTFKNIKKLNDWLSKIGKLEMDFSLNPFGYVLIYIEKDSIVGYIDSSFIYDRAEINDIYVESEYRRKKIGTKLLTTLLDFCKQKGYLNVTLEVDEKNKGARELYKKLGFHSCAVRKNYYPNSHGILMIREFGGKMKDQYVLAIESSCDETSASIIKNGSEELATIVLSQIDTHTLYGGVVPEIASRKHIESITIVLEEVLKKANMHMEEIDFFAVTYGPGLIGSLLVGVQAAKILSYLYHKPLVPVHHIAGHIYANNLMEPMKFPLIALVVSGGHTELIYMREDYSFEKIGGTLDDAVGEAYDKVARILGLGYPGGPKVDDLAHKGCDTYELPLPLDNETYDFSFSGLKSAVINLKHKEEQRGSEIRIADLATSFQNRVVEILVKKTIRALKQYHVKNLIVAGGVAANKGLRESLTKSCEENSIHLVIPDMKYCTDNAAMIGAAAYYAYKIGRRADLKLNAKANDSLK